MRVFLMLFTLAGLTLACSNSGPRFEVAKQGKHYRFRLYAEGAKLLLESDPYDKRASAKAGIKALRKAFSRAKCFRYRIVIKAKNGQPLARSPKYADDRTCEEGLKLAKRVIKEAR